jgi:CBS domain-containing protein
MPEMRVRDVMTHLVVTLRRSDSLESAAKRLAANRISGAPVVAEGKLIGIVTETDLMRAFEPYQERDGAAFPGAPLMFLLRGAPRHAEDLTVADAMTSDVATIRPDAPVREAAAKIDRRSVRRLPVVDQEGYVVGVIARSDLVRAIALSEGALLEASPA